MNWKPIETAPKGSGDQGPSDSGDKDYVEPPKLLLWTEEGPVIGYYDWYYHEGYGMGDGERDSAWCDNEGNEIDPTHWEYAPLGPDVENHKDCGRVLTCVYCGMEYPQDTPSSGSKVLTDHIKVCPKHPMRKAEEDVSKLRNALVMLVMADGKKDLENLRNQIIQKGFDGNKQGILNSIQVLLETLKE